MALNNSAYFFKAFNLIIRAPFPINGLIAVAAQAHDIEVQIGSIEHIPTLAETTIKRKGLVASFATEDATMNDCYLVWEQEIKFKLSHGHTMVVDSASTDLDFLSLFIVSEPLGILLFQRNYILLHASAVKLPNGQGIVFMGEPGMGKSTTSGALIKAGCPLISDDLVAILSIDDKPYLVPSFPQLKLWKRSVEGLGYNYDELTRLVEGTNKYAYQDTENFDEALVPLKTIYELGAEHEETVDKLYTPIELLKYFALPEQLLGKGPHLKQHFQSCIGFAHEIDIFRKPKMKNFEELKLFVNSLI